MSNPTHEDPDQTIAKLKHYVASLESDKEKLLETLKLCDEEHKADIEDHRRQFSLLNDELIEAYNEIKALKEDNDKLKETVRFCDEENRACLQVHHRILSRAHTELDEARQEIKVLKEAQSPTTFQPNSENPTLDDEAHAILAQLRYFQGADLSFEHGLEMAALIPRIETIATSTTNIHLIRDILLVMCSLWIVDDDEDEAANDEDQEAEEKDEDKASPEEEEEEDKEDEMEEDSDGGGNDGRIIHI